MSSSKIWVGLPIFIVVCLGAGGLGAIATTPEIEGWYKTIEKPTWNPPCHCHCSARNLALNGSRPEVSLFRRQSQWEKSR